MGATDPSTSHLQLVEKVVGPLDWYCLRFLVSPGSWIGNSGHERTMARLQIDQDQLGDQKTPGGQTGQWVFCKSRTVVCTVVWGRVLFSYVFLCYFMGITFNVMDCLCVVSGLLRLCRGFGWDAGFEVRFRRFGFLFSRIVFLDVF